jgi:uncharacterized small protein (TIGR04563 family)
MSPKRKVTLYFNAGMLSETQREAIRQDRSVSWIIQAAWKIARDDVRRLPGMGALATPAPDAESESDDDEPVAPALASTDGAPRRPIQD